MEIKYGWTPYYTDTGKRGREVLGIGLHDTETDWTVDPHPAGSWNREIGRDGEVIQFVDYRDIAWHVRDCDRRWPAWLPRETPWPASAANCWTIGYELVSSANYRDPGDDHLDGGPFTEAQYKALRACLALDYAEFGALPIFYHGRVQRDRSDPVGFEPERAGLIEDDQGDFWFAGLDESDQEEIAMETTAEERESYRPYFESYGVGCNMETGIMKRAALAYKRGETRGPALSGEYEALAPDGRPVIRQRFTAGICEYDPATGETHWAEVVLRPEAA